MRDFFRGWRRKMGCVTLVLACVFVFWWARSSFATDVIRFRERNKFLNTYLLDFTTIFDSDQVNVFASDGSSLVWLRRKDRDDNEPIYTLHSASGDVLEKMVPQSDVSNPPFASIPYPAIVIPLALISAYLFLWKPGKEQIQDA